MIVSNSKREDERCLRLVNNTREIFTHDLSDPQLSQVTAYLTGHEITSELSTTAHAAVISRSVGETWLYSIGGYIYTYFSVLFLGIEEGLRTVRGHLASNTYQVSTFPRGVPN